MIDYYQEVVDPIYKHLFVKKIHYSKPLCKEPN